MAMLVIGAQARLEAATTRQGEQLKTTMSQVAAEAAAEDAMDSLVYSWVNRAM